MKNIEVLVNNEKLFVKGGFDTTRNMITGKKARTPKLDLVDEDGLPYAYITRNLGEFIGMPGIAYIDGNALYDIEKMMKDFNLGVKTIFKKQSGFCMYPAYFINPDILESLCDERELKKYILSYDFENEGLTYESLMADLKKAYSEALKELELGA